MKPYAIALLALLFAAAVAAEEHPNLARGFKADKLYDFLGLDTVNDFNGNLIIRIPLGQEYVSNGLLKYTFTLVYNGSLYDYTYSPDNLQLDAKPTLLSNAGGGWRLSLGAILPPIGDPDYIANPGNNSQTWAYVDAASARHGFRDTLHDGDTADTTHFYTRDSSYIRMTVVNNYTRNVEFPDGTRQVFTKYSVPAGGGAWIVSPQGTKWRLASFGDGFGNAIAVSYETTSTYPEIWHVQDGDRQHDVYFVTASTYFDLVLDHVVLKTAGGGTATYSMQYHDLTAYVGGAGDNDVSTRTFPVLVSVSLPDSTSYSMLDGTNVMYDTGSSSGTPGVITQIQLPTTGKISWSYTQLYMQEATWGKSKGNPVPSPPAVFTRTAAGGTWTYDRRLSNGGLQCSCGNNLFCAAHDRQMTAWSTTPDGTAKIQYFSVYKGGDNCLSNGWSDADYGIAGIPVSTSGNGRLAEEHRSSFTPPTSGWTGVGALPAASNDPLWTKQYALYEGETYTALNAFERNLRPKYLKTTYDGDSGCSTCPFLETFMLSFDGYGHYRQKSINGSISGTPNRTTFTNYTGSLDANGDWVLNTPTETCVADETAARSTAIGQCSDLSGGFTTALNYDRSKGIETGRRVLYGAGATATSHDLLNIRTFDSKGSVTYEKFWGGDKQTLSSTTSLFSETQTPAYEIHHDPTYSTAGSLTGRRSSYVNVSSGADYNASIEDVTLDAYTGAVTTSRDGAGVATFYSYDNMGRLHDVGTSKAIRPMGLAPTSITYTIASLSGSTFTPATATVTTSSTTAGTIENIYSYDEFGRISFERTLMPNGHMSRVQRSYNTNGQLSKVTTQVDESDGCWSPSSACPATQYEYDSSGQAKKITAPDGSVTTIARNASGSVSTSVSNVNYTHVENSDALGRLYTVTEKSGATSASQTTGSDVVTTYGYDAQDRLVNVNMQPSGQSAQVRTFSFDSRGLLTTESHPESGSTSYDDYDARGHAWHRVAGAAGGAFDLAYTFDSAERLTLVEDYGSGAVRRTLKQFTFADANNGSNYAQGKLSTAQRINHLSVGEVAVTDSYTYAGPAGIVSRKDTAVTIDGAPFQTFSQTYDYDDFGDATTIAYPVCATATPCSTTNGIGTLSRTFSNGRLTEVGTGAAGSSSAYGVLAYAGNGMLDQVTHPGNAIDTYTPDSTGMPRPTLIRFSGLSTCPSVVVTPGASSMCAGASQTASATSISGATYSWTIDNGTITAGANAANVTFTAGSSASATTLHVSVTSGACTTTASVSVSVTTSVMITQQPTATPASLAPNQTANVSAAASGTNLTYQWYRGAPSDTANPVAGAAGASFTTPPLTVTTSYWVRIGSTCGSIDSNGVTVVVVIPAPTAVTATTQAMAPTAPATTVPVLIQWSAVSSASSYLVEWATNVQGIFYQVATTPGLSVMHNAPVGAAGSLPVAYVYRVRSIDSAGNVSSAVSPMDYAVTGNPLFTNDPIQKQITLVYARHVGELRRAIDALRAAATTPQNPLPPAWSNSPDPTGTISTGPITSLFVPFNAARQVFGYGAFAYSGLAGAQASGPILSEHIQQIRDALH